MSGEERGPEAELGRAEPLDRAELVAQIAAHGRFLDTLGTVGVRWPPAVALTGVPAAVEAASQAPGDSSFAASGTEASVAANQAAPAAAAASASMAPAGGDLEAIRATIGDCRRCRLAAGRKTIVFGQGNPQAELMFVGEAPGADEDEQGLAFVGRAGQLLTDIIEKGLRFRRSDVFIANVIKCRPPQNRNPEPDEILACQPFLEAQIRAIRPRVLVGLGKFGAQWLLKTAEPITRLRGRTGEYEGIAVMPTYHPAYLLRNPSAKKDVWTDMKKVLELLGRPVT
jgi:DNA polymerase